MKLKDALLLGRVSNLPTVWTNTLAALLLAGATPGDARLWLVLAAMTFAYVGGMYLNDAFDAEIDARDRPERPIPSGRVGRGTVYALGFAMLVLSVALVYHAGKAAPYWPVVSALGLAGCIVIYDAYHKGNPFSPVVMGLCRAMVYVTVGTVFLVPLPAALQLGAAMMVCYLIGLTYIAKQETLGRVENLWPLLFLLAPLVYGAMLASENMTVLPFVGLLAVWILRALRYVHRRGPGDIPRAVVSLIAGISILDALLIAGTPAPEWAALALAGWILTLLFQRYVPGT